MTVELPPPARAVLLAPQINSASPISSAKPWYRQFWPWFLIAVPGSVVIASGFMIKLAFDSGDIVVRDDYYKEGLAINEYMARDQLATDLNIAGELELRREAILLRLSQSGQELQYSGPVHNVLVTFHHPFDAQQYLDITLEQSDDQRFYTAAVSVPLQRWYVEITLSGSAAQLSLDGQNWRLRWRALF